MSDKTVMIPGPEGKQLKAEVIDFKTDSEEWNVYKLEDGTTIRTKIVAMQISRGMDDQGKPYYLPNGEPLYNVRHSIQVVSDVPDFMTKKEEGQ